MTAPSSATPEAAPHDDRWARRFVWAVWAGMLLVVLVSFARNARNVPLAEDWLLVPMLTGNEPDVLSWLWAQNNEHRIPLPKALLMAALKLSGGDFRSGMLLNIALIGATSAALIAVARAARGGRTRATDAVLPILLLHLGNWENLFWGWQLTQILPTLLAIAILTVFVRHADLSDSRALGVLAVCLLALPLCGANGLLYVPLPALWLAYRGIETWRLQAERRRRAAAMIGVSGTALLLCGVYFIGLRRPEWVLPNPGIVPSLALALQFLAFGLGPAVQRAWGPAAAATLALMVVAAVILFRAVLTTAGLERRRAIGLLVFSATAAAFVLAMGWGRAGALDVYGYWPLRYVLMATPPFLAAYFIFDRFGSERSRLVAQTGLLSAVVLLVPLNTLGGWVWRDWYGSEAAALEREIDAGQSPATIAARRGEFLIHWWEEWQLIKGMRMLHAAGIGPFARLDTAAAEPAPDERAEAERRAVGADGRPLASQVFAYEAPDAGEVWLVWGVDGWRVLADSLRPPGTTIAGRVMRTPMRREASRFVASVRIPRGTTVDYGFLTTRRFDSVEVRQLWDHRPAYRFVANGDTAVTVEAAVALESVKSRRIWPWVLGALVLLSVTGGAGMLRRRRASRA